MAAKSVAFMDPSDSTKGQDRKSLRTSQEKIIPVIEEQVEIRKERVETKKVLLHKTVQEEVEELQIPVTQQSFFVHRVKKNEEITEPPQVRQEGTKTIIPVVAEKVVVRKQLILVEEIHIERQEFTTTEAHEVKLRKEKVSIESDKPEDTEQK